MIIKCCGRCTGTNFKNMKEHGFVNNIFVDGKMVSEPTLYYCFDCESWSCEEKIYKLGNLER